MVNNSFEFSVKTKGNAKPAGKPRVYFTCHPADFDRSFEKICEDLFAAHDCAVYYTADMNDEIPEDNRETDLNRMNLFVIPITFRLLTQPNRAMNFDFPFAKEKHIPVLPIMLESGIDEFYSRPDKFGELQYLIPYNTDLTAISYAEKLKKYLESVLIDSELAKRIRAAFDAYIFLSYRKKDRRLANELMRLIHRRAELRDVAVWYDEYLTPGESFRDNIGQMLRDSKLFTLLVTPNLLEEPNGRPNYVMGVEYPAARDSGMEILPTEMEPTDRDALAEKFAGLPTCLQMDGEAIYQRLLDTLSSTAKHENDEDPTHNYLIGLAYLDGIDVEVDRERSLAMIISAAEAGLPEAMEKLFQMYSEGKSVSLDYHKACYWAEKHAKKMISIHGENHPDALTSLHNLAYMHHKLGNHQKALELFEKTYALRCKTLGEEHPDTLASLNDLAVTYGNLGDHHKALGLKKKAFDLRCKILGEEHPATLTSMNNLAATYLDIGYVEKALELFEKVYALRCKTLGEEHPDTLTSLNILAVIYGDLGDHQKELELHEKVYALRCRILGEDHPDTLASLNILAVTYGNLGNHDKELELHEKVYALRLKILGEDHPDTMTALSNLAFTYGDLGDHQKELELHEKVYALRCRILGEDHPDTLSSLHNLSIASGKSIDTPDEKLGAFLATHSAAKNIYSFIKASLPGDVNEEYYDVVEFEDGEYVLVKEFSIGTNTYYYFVSENDPTDFMFRKLLVEAGEEYFVGLDSDEEFDMVYSAFRKRILDEAEQSASD